MSLLTQQDYFAPTKECSYYKLTLIDAVMIHLTQDKIPFVSV